MAQRSPKRITRRNTNENRIRLKVKENPNYNRRYKQKRQNKNDNRIKITLSFFTLIFIISLTYLTLNKRSELINKRYEYNNLVSEVISVELQRDKLKANLENTIDLNSIQRYAIEELGMVYKNTDNENHETNGN